MKKLFLFPSLILLVIGFILSGCATSTPTNTQPSTSAPTTTAPTTTIAPTNTTVATTQPALTAPTAQKTLTLGFITDLGSTLGNQIMNLQLLMAEMDNAQGGLKIGNDYYKVKVIVYSTDNDFNKAVAAVNRLIFQDKVKYLISHGVATADYVCPIAQPEKVLTFSTSAIWNSGFLDKWTYNYAALGQGTHEVAVGGYLVETYPDMKKPNGMAIACPDNAAGHQTFSNFGMPYRALGAMPNAVYYPADQRDLSSLGTKIKMMNPSSFMPGIGKVEDMGLITAACYDAGYRGRNFTFLTSDVGLLVPVFKPEVLEGFICGASAMEFNPPRTEWAATLKNAWIAKYGKWDFPDYMNTPEYTALVAAMQKAGSIDVDQVNAALHTPGLEFKVPDGKGIMITRPDMRLDGLAVDAVMDNVLKIVKNKQPEVLAAFTPEKSLEYVRKAYPPLPPGQTPTIFKPQ